MLVKTDSPAVNTFITPRPPALAGARSSRIIRPSRNRPSRCGASRKSSAERLGGVSTTIKSQLPVAFNWPSFSMAMYSCVPAKLDERDT